MRKHTERASEILARRQPQPDPAPESATRPRAPSDATGEEGNLNSAEQAPVVAGSLLHDGRLASRGNGQLLQAALQAMQRTYGNRAVQRFLQRAPSAVAPPAAVLGSARQPALPARPIQRAWPAAAPSGATTQQPGVSAPQGGSWNADDTVTIGTIRRIPVAGLTPTGVADDADVRAYQEPAGGQVRDHTAESDVTRASKGHPSPGQAIVLVPEPLGVPQGGQVDVLLHLHGHGIGFRQRKKDRIGGDDKPVAGMEAGT